MNASQSTGVVDNGGLVGEASQPDAAKPLLDTPQSKAAGIAMWVAVLLPLIGLAVAIPVGWGWGLSILDLSMAAIAYVVTGLAVTVGYHRGFTHRSFKARRGLRIALAVGGSLAVEVGKRLLSPRTVDLMASNHVGDLFAQASAARQGMGFGLTVEVVMDGIQANRRTSNGSGASERLPLRAPAARPAHPEPWARPVPSHWAAEWKS